MSNAIEPKGPSQELALYKQATDVAGLCKSIVVNKAVEIQGRKFVPVEAWNTIAVAHGCIVSIRTVEMTPEGTRAVAELKRQTDGMVLSTAEGFVGTDEPVWYGGPGTKWNRFKKCEEEAIFKKRPDYAIRAMAQTRAASRVCRTAFAHVVVLMDAGLETTPAEEIRGTEDDDIPGAEANAAPPAADPVAGAKNVTPAPAAGKTVKVPRDVDPGLREQFRGGKWESVKLHWSKHKDERLGDLPEKTLSWFMNEWQPKPFGNKPISDADKLLRAALDVAQEETAQK